MALSGRPKVLNYDQLPDAVKRCEYAVRGELYRAATARVASGKEVRHCIHARLLLRMIH